VTTQLPQDIEEILDENGKELGVRIFIRPDESAILFRQGNINLVLPKLDDISDLARLNATLTAALASRLSEHEWMRDLLEWFEQKTSSSTDEELMEKLSNGG
jgi:hypothetical protein